MNAAVYARYSSDNQNDQSIDAQLNAIHDYANRNQITVVKTYIDRAKSATTDKRPEFQRMISDCKMGLFDAVIVHKLDRFARNRYDSAHYKYQIKKCGLKLISVLERLDDSPESIMMESVLEGMAEYYSRNLAREVMKNMKECAHKCRHLGGRPPIGYDVNPETKQYEINEYEAEIVKTIFAMYLNGDGYSRIVNCLNAQGYRTKIGRPFTVNSMHDILSNEKYSGTYVFNRTTSKDANNKRNNHRSKNEEDIIKIPGGMPAIISEAEYQKVKDKMEQNRHRAGAYKAKEIYLLSGLIFCGECGQALVGNSRRAGRSKELYVTYRCNNRYRTRTCDNKEIRREYIEAYVLSQLEAKIFNEKRLPQLAKQFNKYMQQQNSDITVKAGALNGQISRLNKEIADIIRIVRQGCSSPSLVSELEKAEKEKAGLEVQLKQILNSQSTIHIDEQTLKNVLANHWDAVINRNISECKPFIDQYVEKVLVYGDYVKVVFHLYIDLVSFGGGGGSRTPVRKNDQPGVSERSSCFEFRSAGAHEQAPSSYPR